MSATTRISCTSRWPSLRVAFSLYLFHIHHLIDPWGWTVLVQPVLPHPHQDVGHRDPRSCPIAWLEDFTHFTVFFLRCRQPSQPLTCMPSFSLLLFTVLVWLVFFFLDRPPACERRVLPFGWIVSASTKRIAPGEPPRGHQRTSGPSVVPKRFHGVLGARRHVPTAGRDQRRNRGFVPLECRHGRIRFPFRVAGPPCSCLGSLPTPTARAHLHSSCRHGRFARLHGREVSLTSTCGLVGSHSSPRHRQGGVEEGSKPQGSQEMERNGDVACKGQAPDRWERIEGSWSLSHVV